MLCSALDCGNIVWSSSILLRDICGSGGHIPIVIPLQVRQLYPALPRIVAICISQFYIVKKHMVVGGGVFR